ESAIGAVLGKKVVDAPSGDVGGPLRSPGRLARHYAPRARVLVWEWDDDATLLDLIDRHNLALAACHVITHLRPPNTPGLGNVRVLPREAKAYARSLYTAMHECDEAGAAFIIVRSPPDSPEWKAINDRLRRASAVEDQS
ncbi:MAG: hypothetical protein N2255_00375, partial [Kiritimatiellae bacterium]|nr:hypothetical protein [Kiritimatiellia bacterium]